MSPVDIFRNTLGFMVVDDVIWIFLSANDRSLFGPCHTSRNGRATATAAVLIRVLTDRGLPVNFWTIVDPFRNTLEGKGVSSSMPLSRSVCH